MPNKNSHARIGLELNEAELDRLRDIGVRLSIPQTRFLRACIRVLDDEEVTRIARKYNELAALDNAAKIRARYAAKDQPASETP